MAQTIRVIIVNADDDYQPALRTELLGVEDVKIIAEVNDVDVMQVALEQYPSDVILVHLDPNPDIYLEAAIQAAATLPDCSVFALSECTDGQLILAALRGGLREFLTKPLDRNQLREALAKAAQSRPERQTQGKLYSFVASVGGVGTTTLATNLAAEMADLHDGPVALVDLDFRFGQVATLLDLQPTYTVADLCDTPEMLEPSLIQKVMIQHETGVHVLARPNSFAQADSITAAHCASVLSALQEQYDYVVVDGPTRFDSGGKAVLNMADITFLVIQLLVTSVRNVHRIIEGLQSDGYNPDRLRLICNRTGGKEVGDLEPEHVEKTLNQSIFWPIADEWKAVSAAINRGEPLLTTFPKSKVRMSIRRLGEKLLSGDDIAAEPRRPIKKSGGFLKKMFSDA